jgi:hypothetical protein
MKAAHEVIEKATVVALEEVGLRFQREVHALLSRRGSGRIYRIAKGKKSGKTLRERGFHQASAPGEPPAPDLGHLRRSFQASGGDAIFGLSPKDRPGVVRAWRVGTRVRYARWLEYGTRSIKPRPFIRVARDGVHRYAVPILSKHVKAAMRAKR